MRYNKNKNEELDLMVTRKELLDLGYKYKEITDNIPITKGLVTLKTIRLIRRNI